MSAKRDKDPDSASATHRVPLVNLPSELVVWFESPTFTFSAMEKMSRAVREKVPPVIYQTNQTGQTEQTRPATRPTRLASRIGKMASNLILAHHFIPTLLHKR